MLYVALFYSIISKWQSKINTPIISWNRFLQLVTFFIHLNLTTSCTDEADGKLKSEDLQTSSDQWWITTIQGTVKTADGVNYLELIEPDLKKLGNLSVRVESYGLKAYVLVEGKLKTYDDVNCGTF